MQILLAAVCLLITCAAHAQSLEAFTGTWKVDPGKVQEKATLLNNTPAGAPEVPPPPPPEHKYTLEKIWQTAEVLKISGGEAGTTAVYTIDPSGKEVSDPVPDAPGSVRIATTSWSEGKLVTKWKMERNGEEFMHGTDVHTITPEGALLLVRNIESPRHHAEVRLTFEKDP